MAIIKCKMCGGDMDLSPDKTFGTCEYCGSTMTLPKTDDDQRAAAFNRGNHFRRQGEFDKALAVYERIVAEDDTDAEAHWCCALCRFGIEYVEDPATMEYLPTCHRASFDSILEDVDYLVAVEHSDGITRRQYQKDASKIAEVQRGILATSQKEEPFDVFICYKETDAETGERSRDSIDAQEVYYQLTEKSYRVFFARVTLEDKAGAEYEPYIFAALNSAKVMIVLGEKPEHFSAVWVKNEWSRFLSLMKKDRSRLLLPCYKNMDPYDLPEQLAVLQSYDMGKIGFMQDLIRGVDKVLKRDEQKETVKETVVREVVQQSAGGANLTAQIKRGMQALEDHDWSAADGFFDKALDIDAECAEAFFGKALAKARCINGDDLVHHRLSIPVTDSELLIACEPDNTLIDQVVSEYEVPGYLSREAILACFAYDERTYSSQTNTWKLRIADETNYWEQDRHMSRAVRYAKGELVEMLQSLRVRVETGLQDYLKRSEKLDGEKSTEIASRYQKENKLAIEKVKQQRTDAEKKRREDYDDACKFQQSAKTGLDYDNAARRFESIGLRDFEDSNERSKQCRTQMERLHTEALAEAQAKKTKKDKAKRGVVIAITSVVILLAAFIITSKIILPNAKYKKALDFKEAGDYRSSVVKLEELDGYKNSTEIINEIKSSTEWRRICPVGETFLWGAYEQDNDNLNGKESIEWLVLEKREDKALVISKYALDFQQYDSYLNNGVTWEASSVCAWLNNTFLNDAFAYEEQEMIVNVTISDEQSNNSSNLGDSALNRIFLLSSSEVVDYFETEGARQCQGTPYCYSFAPYKDSDGNCRWMLRPFGNSAAYVDSDGTIKDNKVYRGSFFTVRPALWVDIG